MIKEIYYPKKRSEAEIQALLWYFLKKRKLDARLEVPGFYQYDGDKPRRCIFDIVIFRSEKAVCIIECKSWSSSYNSNQKYRRHHNTRQLTRYKDVFGLPVVVVGRINKIDDAIQEIEHILGIITSYPHK